MKPSKPPVVMTIHQMFQRLSRILEAAPAEERQQFKESWLKSVVEFNKRTEQIRFENRKRS